MCPRSPASHRISIPSYLLVELSKARLFSIPRHNPFVFASFSLSKQPGVDSRGQRRTGLIVRVPCGRIEWMREEEARRFVGGDNRSSACSLVPLFRHDHCSNGESRSPPRHAQRRHRTQTETPTATLRTFYDSQPSTARTCRSRYRRTFARPPAIRARSTARLPLNSFLSLTQPG
jgi:hypothetical protein